MPSKTFETKMERCFDGFDGKKSYEGSRLGFGGKK